MGLLIDIWQIGCVILAAFIVVRLIITFLGGVGKIEPSEQILLILQKYEDLNRSGKSLFGEKLNLVLTPLAMFACLTVFVLFWPIFAIYAIAK